MKSKKIIALALTAAIAISAASMTAFAKEVKYNTETDVKNPEELVATVSLTKDDDIVKSETTKTYKTTTGATLDSPITQEEYDSLGADTQAKYEEDTTETKYYVLFKDLGLKKFERTITKQQFGWVKGETNDWQTDKDPAKKDSVYKDDDKVYLEVDSGDAFKDLTFATVGRTDTDNDTIKKNQEAIDAAASDAKKAADRDAQLAKLDEENGATNNVNTGKGVETKKAEVSDPVAAGDVSEMWTDGHALKVAGLDASLSNLAWVYDVSKPAGLINGKTARAQLKLPSGYTTSGYKVAVYHIKGWCSAEKVKGVNVGTNDVAFWANDFSPYVLVLTPKDAVAGTSTGNPSTGDFSAVPVAMLAAAALGATGFVAYKKRKAE